MGGEGEGARGQGEEEDREQPSNQPLSKSENKVYRNRERKTLELKGRQDNLS